MKKREIPALLRPKMMDLDYSVLAEMIRQQGRGRDKILAHITPDEARLLKQRGGRGSINPTTGLPEFQEDFVSGYDVPSMDVGIAQPTSFDIRDEQPAEDAYATYIQNAPVVTGYPELREQEAGVYEPGGFYGRGRQDVVNESVNQIRNLAQLQSYPQAVIPPFPSSYVSGEESPTGVQPTQPGFLDKLSEETKKYFQSPTNVLRALGTLGTVGLGGLAYRQAGRQGGAAQRELQDIGAPYRARGQELVAAGQRGELTAPQQQALQQIRAQSQQQLARAGIRGGTAALQAEAAIQRQAEQFAQQNIDRGLQLLNIADKYTAQGIKAAYQADADARNLALRFFTAATQQIPQGSPTAVQTVPAGR